ncbi:sensor histidine kinase [Granulicella sibirica]|uniref:histidine kinase n=1 Tax=Granulicella sibirica TaxID=2479048 RepID=A0A4Q0T3D7_9BACT|nr:HAMP domain-containing sensor histidine kinase [Granulicella sibirica]RXH57422.1 histidine kinase [Granulicella sibirica]
MLEQIPLMPHAVCWAAAPRLIWTMVVTNFITFLSYLTICGTLLYLVSRTRRVIARDWAYFVVGFALFIVACGSTHLLEVITTWIPVFWVDAGTNIVTAALSAYVAVMLIRRASTIGFAINDYSGRLANVEHEKSLIRDQLISARKMEDWSRMSAVISHEISNPLESIQNVLYLIQTNPDSSNEAVRLASIAGDEVQRVITISRSTLSFHRESTKPELVDLRSVCESVRFLLTSAIAKREIRFEIFSEGDAHVEAYPGETRQVVLNLARNACEAITENGRKVTLNLRPLRNGVELQVTDQGTGIPADVRPRLFEFGKSSKGDEGNGMGLWTVKQIIEKHGGEVQVDSSYQGGTRFIVWWPRSYSPAQPQQVLTASR